MAFKEIQTQVDDWVGQHTTGYWQPHEIIARLAEETGELAREVNHRWGPKKKNSTEEMGDIIFTMTCFANAQNINLDEAFSRVVDKCYGRDIERLKKPV